MIEYLSMFIISVFFAILSEKTAKKVSKIIFQILAVLPFIIISSIRYNVGTDYFFRYVPNYLDIVNNKIVPSLEPLFVLLIKVCIFFTTNPTILFVITSILINGIIFYTIFKYSKSPILSIIIYFLGSFFFGSMNIVRQFLSMTIILGSYRLLFSKEYKFLYIIPVIIATLIHTMSLIYLILLFLNKKPIKLKYFMVITILIFIVGLGLGKFVDYVINNTSLQNDINILKYVKYFEIEFSLNWTNIISESIIYIFIYKCYWELKNREEIEKEATFFYNLQTIAIFCVILSIYYPLFFRITIAFTIFQILSIPYFWNKFKFKENKILTIQTKATIFTLIIIGVISARLIYSNVILQKEEVVPYRTIFEKTEEK